MAYCRSKKKIEGKGNEDFSVRENKNRMNGRGKTAGFFSHSGIESDLFCVLVFTDIND
jgi:hypothetical protein